ncbi:phenylacetate--CoA ligase family protein [Williamsia sp. D3]|uniref:phenylacetate--CoA ligase family protein n=1 Tax=Williamsia sp. D3 TaxID=1313067 RepID=UPI0003D331E0|nr:phenylacetate--CoA ligase family protein [Williamsia sp. D3]ETD31219.1 coenzyme F390 synthetase [Williamsia sp. D3]
MTELDDDLKALQRDIRNAVRGAPDGIDERQRRRLDELVAHVRQHSPYFGRLYRDLPWSGATITDLPITSKTELMDSFDEWVTDPRVTLDGVQKFVGDQASAGSAFLGDYLVTTTSGTTGHVGYFVTEEFAFRVTRALGTRERRMSVVETARFLRRGRRTAVIAATSGHHMARALLARQQVQAGERQLARLLPVDTPIGELVDQLNAFDPAVLSGYSSTLLLLAEEQARRRLHIRPVIVRPIAEGMTPEMAKRLRDAWQAPVVNSYGANECMFIARECGLGWQHLNADWVVLEPIDRDGRPTAPGVASHSVLLTTLFRRVQPIIRYQLGDSITMKSDACECGNRLPAFRVSGRVAEFLHVESSGGVREFAPSEIGGALGAVTRWAQYQFVRESATRVGVRVRPVAGDDRAVVAAEMVAGLTTFFVERGVPEVTVFDTGELPRQSPGGKYLRVVSQ